MHRPHNLALLLCHSLTTASARTSGRNAAVFSPHRRPVIAIPKDAIPIAQRLFYENFAQPCLLAAIGRAVLSPEASAQSRAQYESMVAAHARANNVPEALVHRVIVRESKYHPNLVGRGGTIGLMQIKLATARGLGYTGDAAGLRDPDTNLA